LQELAQYSFVMNLLPRCHRACPSISLDKKVMFCYSIVARINPHFRLKRVTSQRNIRSKTILINKIRIVGAYIGKVINLSKWYDMK
jgi:hypothetical protein